jgi:hypothetical protein
MLVQIADDGKDPQSIKKKKSTNKHKLFRQGDVVLLRSMHSIDGYL